MKKISCLVIAITLILTLLGGCAVTPATSGSPTITPECNTGRVTQSPTAGVSATPTLTVTSTPTVIPSPLITPSSSATVSSEDEDIVYLDYQDGRKELEPAPVYSDNSVGASRTQIREGYTFHGWYTEPECINESSLYYSSIPVNEASRKRILYAKWVKDKPSTNTSGNTYTDLFPNAYLRANALYHVGGEKTNTDVVTEADKKMIATIEYLNFQGLNITDLTGLEYFSGLKSLNCFKNQLTKLDVSKNTVLETLICGFNQITTLDLSKNPALRRVDCNNNQLTKLDVFRNTSLEELNCSTNQLTTLNLSKNPVLKHLSCRNNQLKELDISRNTELESLDCRNNQLTTLDMSNNKELEQPFCDTDVVKK